MSSSYRMELDRWLSQLDVSADTVLDLGGAQLPVKGRTKSWDVRTCLTADLPQPHASSPAPDIPIDLNNPAIAPLPYYESFDLVFCLEVFDYIYQPFIALNVIKAWMKPGGTAWVTFPSFYPTHQPIEDDALRYMEGGIRKLAAAAGLTIQQMIKRRPESQLLDAFYRTERMRAAKHYDHEFTGWIVEFTK